MLEYLIPSCGAITAITTVIITLLKLRNASKKEVQLRNELQLQSSALDFGMFMREWSETFKELEAILQETRIDRFLILRAWNGQLTPKWTTAVLQLRQAGQQTYSYVHFELDTDYVDKLRRIIDTGSIQFKVATLEDSAVKSIYKNEGITESFWSYLASHKGVDAESIVHTYCSFSTRDPDGLTETEITRANMAIGRLRAIANQFNPTGSK